MAYQGGDDDVYEQRNGGYEGNGPVKPHGETTQTRPLWEIAEDILATWPKVYFGAVPYLEAMSDLNSINESYGLDSARSIVRYFLCNAKTYRGADARRIKAELQSLVK